MGRILLVEDNEMNRDMLSRRLAGRGYDVLLAVDGESALEIAQAQRPELVLMDMSLPVLDGWEATRRLKSGTETRGIPIIALTAHAMSGDREKALDAGCDDYDTKPIELPRLLAKIDAALRRIEMGEYGYCEVTGDPISLKRLDARPIATLSLEAQERHERRERLPDRPVVLGGVLGVVRRHDLHDRVVDAQLSHRRTQRLLLDRGKGGDDPAHQRAHDQDRDEHGRARAGVYRSAS